MNEWKWLSEQPLHFFLFKALKYKHLYLGFQIYYNEWHNSLFFPHSRHCHWITVLLLSESRHCLRIIFKHAFQKVLQIIWVHIGNLFLVVFLDLIFGMYAIFYIFHSTFNTLSHVFLWINIWVSKQDLSSHG